MVVKSYFYLNGVRGLGSEKFTYGWEGGGMELDTFPAISEPVLNYMYMNNCVSK